MKSKYPWAKLLLSEFQLTVSAAVPSEGIAKVSCEVLMSAPSRYVLVAEEAPSP